MSAEFVPETAPAVKARLAARAVAAGLVHPRELSAGDIALWRQFQAASPWLESPFFAPEFTLAAGAARSDTRVGILRRAGAIIGFFPFHLAPRAIGKPVGGTFSDYQGPILSSDGTMTAEQLLRACRLRAYDFNHGPIDLQPLQTGSILTSQSPRIVFGDGYAAYTAASPPTRMDAIRNTERRARKIERELGKVVYRFDDRRPESWDWLVRTKTEALAREGTQAGFEIDWIKQMLVQLRGTRTTGFTGLVSTLSCGDQMMAAHFGLRYGPVLCWWHTTFDEQYRQYAPGLMLLLSTVREGAADGLSVIDLGRGNQHYKLVFANDSSALCEGAIARKGSIAAALRYGHKLVSDVSARLPLGDHEDLPRRAVGRIISNVRLPALRQGGPET